MSPSTHLPTLMHKRVMDLNELERLNRLSGLLHHDQPRELGFWVYILTDMSPLPNLLLVVLEDDAKGRKSIFCLI